MAGGACVVGISMPLHLNPPFSDRTQSVLEQVLTKMTNPKYPDKNDKLSSFAFPPLSLNYTYKF
jgi:hypothetical protein